MSETPIVPVLEPSSEQIKHNVEQRYYTGQVDRDFSAWERGFDTESRFDLDRDETINPDVWADKTPTTYEIPAHAEAPKTRAQEIEESLFYLTDKQLLDYARINTQAIPALRHLV